MPGSKGDAYELDVLRAAVGQATTVITTTPLAEVWLALYTGAAAADGPGTEATGGGYARKACKAAWGAPANGSITTTAAITVGPFTGAVSSGAAITHFALVSASTGGSVLYWGDLSDATKTFGNGDSAVFAAGALTITEQ